MSVNLETVNAYMRTVMEQRDIILKQLGEVEIKRDSSFDEVEIAKEDYEEAKLLQKISLLNSKLKSCELDLRMARIQEEFSQKNITEAECNNQIAEAKKAKEELEKSPELSKYKINKCEKALNYYTLIGDDEKAKKWKQKLERAKGNTVTTKAVEKQSKEHEGDNKEKDRSPKGFKDSIHFEFTPTVHQQALKRYIEAENIFKQRNVENPKETGMEFNGMA